MMTSAKNKSRSHPLQSTASDCRVSRLLFSETTLRIGYVDEVDCFEIRRVGLAPAQAKPVPAYPYALDQFHLAAFIGSEITSVATFLMEDQTEDGSYTATGDCWRLRAMATHPDHRNRGYSTAVLEHGMRILKQKQAAFLWANGRSTAISFYLRNGFSKIGRERRVPGLAPHYRIVRRL
ncbi:GNAT family N-acetyltransferase [Rhizobium calliandrae]|uniref:GNAT family N-acetyltransferase n=1 Tax=Rhizobium calliandrae TaxID=1312182 RepID=A0ABT7KQX1_9HYPH|nr:GNAT family N-acetyltransferase [Rhizobium calliandrae]MDL2410343.1 GNAT family N-acetyltransferase [Rhizobium calliandrae]